MKEKKYSMPNSNSVKEISYEVLMPVIRELIDEGRAVKIYPRGTSMRPTLVEGRDTVVLNAKGERLKRFASALFQRTDGTYVLHRAVKIGDTVTFLGDAQGIAECGITSENIIAVAVAVERFGKEHRLGITSRIFGARFYYKLLLKRGYKKTIRIFKRSLKYIVRFTGFGK